MKKTSLKIAVCSCLLLGSTSVLAGPINTLINGSFEDGFNGWTLGGVYTDGFAPVVINYNSATAYPTGAFGESVPSDNAAGNPGFDASGLHAAYFVSDTANPQTLSQTVETIAGIKYTFGFDVYLPANGSSNINDSAFSATVGTNTFASFLGSGTAATTWTHFSSEAIADVTGSSQFTMTFHSSGFPSKDFVIDRVYFAPTDTIPEPTSVLLSSSVLALGFWIRRRFID